MASPFLYDDFIQNEVYPVNSFDRTGKSNQFSGFVVIFIHYQSPDQVRINDKCFPIVSQCLFVASYGLLVIELLLSIHPTHQTQSINT